MKWTTFLRAAYAVAALLLPAVPAMAMDAIVTKIGSLEISGGFARATLPNAPVAGGFLTIVNKGDQDDRLISVTSPAAGEVQLHEMTMDGGVMKMRELKDGIPVPAGATVKLDPSNLHLMFMHLKQPFVEGTTIPVTLTFERAGSVEVKLSVGGIAAKAQPMGNMSMAPVDKAAPIASQDANGTMMIDPSLIRPKA